MNYQFTSNLQQAQQLDQEDPLAKIRDHFYIQPGQIYMDGNSLGLASKEAETALLKMMNIWKTQGINMWDEYFHYGLELGAQ